MNAHVAAINPRATMSAVAALAPWFHNLHLPDLVWFMGVLYHLRHPLLALDILRRRTRKLLMLQSLTMPGDAAIEPPSDFPIDQRMRLLADGWPRMAFIEKRMSGDPPTGGPPTTPACRRCCAHRGFASASASRTKPICASPRRTVHGRR